MPQMSIGRTGLGPIAESAVKRIADAQRAVKTTVRIPASLKRIGIQMSSRLGLPQSK